MKNDEPDALDRALDKPLDNALAQYSSEEPLAGLEQRVLNRVRAEGAPPRSGFGRRGAAAGGAVVGGGGGGGGAGGRGAAVWWDRPAPPPPFPGQAARPVPLANARPVPKRATPAGFRKRPGQPRRPVPLSSEERALLALVARAPDQAREALLDLQRRSTAPIQVEEIRIEPLRSDDAK